MDETPVIQLAKAVAFAAEKHRDQRRKDQHKTPYVNHVIAVVRTLAARGGVTDPTLLVAGYLHDTVEDTRTTPDELESEFGADVRRLVAEVSDDKTLPADERKRLQIEHSPQLSDRGKQLKLADLACNVHDIAFSPPVTWDLERRGNYLKWAQQVATGCREVNHRLDSHFDQALASATLHLSQAG
jgi:(p)ppGpp synthase/HD superfamily hydrolase